MVGTKDQIVSIQTAEDFCNTIRKKGVECELHLFKDAGHPIFLYREPLTKNFYKIRNLTDAFLKRNGFLTDTLNTSARTTKKE